MREDKAGRADPVGVVMSLARVGGNIGPTRGGSFPSALLEKGNEVANLDDSSVMGKDRVPATVAREYRIEPHQRSRCFSVGLPTPQTDRHLMVSTKCF